jgi:glutamate--cysteine ligase catalytic subunit
MPMHKGKLLDTDTRWEFLEQAVDDRTPRERAVGGLEKSRYSPINHFISNDPRNLNLYNDKKYTLNKSILKYIKKEAKKQGLKIDKRLRNHLAYLMVRDNICLFDDAVGFGHPDSTAHFEAYQSSNWNDVRFKPPPSMHSPIGWRVEFRTVDTQIHPKQNFLFSHAVLVLFRMVTCNKLGLNMYIPMSLVSSEI